MPSSFQWRCRIHRDAAVSCEPPRKRGSKSTEVDVDGVRPGCNSGKFLDDWCEQVMRSRIQPMKKIAQTLRSHRELLLNYFRAKRRLSSGVVEGLNNKAKLTMRKSYGFRTFRITEIALYHALGKLPEPDVAHRFF